MNWRWLIFACSVWLVQWPISGFAAETQRLVAVANSQSEIGRLSSEEVRRIYLGASTTSGGIRVRPLRNGVDDLAQEVFLQKVLYMSAQQYENLALARVFRSGGVRPPEYRNLTALLGALRQDTNAITYMWEDQAASLGTLKIVGLLWQGQP